MPLVPQKKFNLTTFYHRKTTQIKEQCLITTEHKNTQQCNYIQQFGKLCIKYTWISAFLQTTLLQSSEKYNIQTIKTHTQKAEAKESNKNNNKKVNNALPCHFFVCFFFLLQPAVTVNTNY